MNLVCSVQAPAPPPGYQSDRNLYSQNIGQQPTKKSFRPLPQAPEKILDAPDMVDDYYLNLLDWGTGNTVSNTTFKRPKPLSLHLWLGLSGYCNAVFAVSTPPA